MLRISAQLDGCGISAADFLCCAGHSLTLGASAAIFGLLGALVYYGRRTGSSLVRGEAVRYAVILGVLGLIMPGIDNFAHAGGFFGGYLMSRFLDPLKPERIDHIMIALLCLAAVFLSIAASVITRAEAVSRFTYSGRAQRGEECCPTPLYQFSTI